MKEPSITGSQIQEMQHCIGLDYKCPKRGKYEAYRNYCVYTAKQPLWENLIKIGYAECNNENRDGYVPKISYYYSLTQAGLDFMGLIMGCKIIER